MPELSKNNRAHIHNKTKQCIKEQLELIIVSSNKDKATVVIYKSDYENKTKYTSTTSNYGQISFHFKDMISGISVDNSEILESFDII